MLIQKMRLKQGWSRQQLGFSVLRPDWLLGPQWERRQVETRPGRRL